MARGKPAKLIDPVRIDNLIRLPPCNRTRSLNLRPFRLFPPGIVWAQLNSHHRNNYPPRSCGVCRLRDNNIQLRSPQSRQLCRQSNIRVRLHSAHTEISQLNPPPTKSPPDIPHNSPPKMPLQIRHIFLPDIVRVPCRPRNNTLPRKL
jgi:hypothetical protein